MIPDEHASEKQLLCQHLNFSAIVTVARLTDTGRFMADVTIKCADCDLPFCFKGLPVGLDCNGATISPDGIEARLAIAPGPGGILYNNE